MRSLQVGYKGCGCSGVLVCVCCACKTGKTSSVREVGITPGSAGVSSNVYSPSTWAKQRRSEFKAGQLSHQQSMSVSNMANTIDMDDNERKIVTEFCHYLEKSKQLFNGLR
jgi:hypothetical protein